MAIEDPTKYQPDPLPGWSSWSCGRVVDGVYQPDGIAFRNLTCSGYKDTLETEVIVNTTANASDGAALAYAYSRDFQELLGFQLQREGFLGDRSYELLGTGALSGSWLIIWCRQHVVGLVYSFSRDDAYAWVEAADALFPGGVGIPEEAKGELQNPDFPPAVDAGETWTGYIDAVNVGTASGNFRIRIDAWGITTPPFTLGVGERLHWEFSHTGPDEFDIVLERETDAGWVVDNTEHIVVPETGVGARGELQNPDFPPEAAPEDVWMGTIDTVNVGDAAGTFRLGYMGTYGNQFSLSLGQSTTEAISGIGPVDFWIVLERDTAAGWVEDDREHIVIAEKGAPRALPAMILATGGVAVAGLVLWKASSQTI